MEDSGDRKVEDGECLRSTSNGNDIETVGDWLGIGTEKYSGIEGGGLDICHVSSISEASPDQPKVESIEQSLFGLSQLATVVTDSLTSDDVFGTFLGHPNPSGPSRLSSLNDSGLDLDNSGMGRNYCHVYSSIDYSRIPRDAVQHDSLTQLSSSFLLQHHRTPYGSPSQCMKLDKSNHSLGNLSPLQYLTTAIHGYSSSPLGSTDFALEEAHSSQTPDPPTYGAENFPSGAASPFLNFHRKAGGCRGESGLGMTNSSPCIQENWEARRKRYSEESLVRKRTLTDLCNVTRSDWEDLISNGVGGFGEVIPSRNLTTPDLEPPKMMGFATPPLSYIGRNLHSMENWNVDKRATISFSSKLDHEIERSSNFSPDSGLYIKSLAKRSGSTPQGCSWDEGRDDEDNETYQEVLVVGPKHQVSPKYTPRQKFKLSKEKARSIRHTPSASSSPSSSKSSARSDRKCANCACTKTPSWRRTKNGAVLCNACGL